MRTVDRKVGSRAAHGTIAPLLQRTLGLRVRKAPWAQNRIAELTHSCLDTLDWWLWRRQLFTGQLSFKQNTGPGWEPGAQMVVAGKDSSQRVREAEHIPSHTAAAGAVDT
jgi:hypothetical protein